MQWATVKTWYMGYGHPIIILLEIPYNEYSSP